jgi:hypothetical protein
LYSREFIVVIASFRSVAERLTVVVGVLRVDGT